MKEKLGRDYQVDGVEKKERKNSENLHLTGHLFKMAKGFKGIFGISDEKRENLHEVKDQIEDENVKETSIEENIGDNLSERSSNPSPLQEEFPPSLNVLSETFQNLSHFEDGRLRSPIYELSKDDIKSLPTETLEKLKLNSLYLKYKNNQFFNSNPDHLPLTPTYRVPKSRHSLPASSMSSLRPSSLRLSLHIELIRTNSYHALLHCYLITLPALVPSRLSQLKSQIVSPQGNIKNMELFCVLLQLLSTCTDFHIVQEGLDILLKVLREHIVNCMAFVGTHGVQQVIQVIHRVLGVSKDGHR